MTGLMMGGGGGVGGAGGVAGGVTGGGGGEGTRKKDLSFMAAKNFQREQSTATETLMKMTSTSSQQ